MFKEYCLKYGTFVYPCQNKNPLYYEVYETFYIGRVWSQNVFYCKPYYKQNNRDYKSKHYGGTISKPNFLHKEEKDIDIFLNGEFLEV